MLEVKFYDSVDDSLLKFAVIVSQSKANGYFAGIKKETPMKFRVDIEKPVKAFLKRRKENCRKKPVQSGSI